MHIAEVVFARHGRHRVKSASRTCVSSSGGSIRRTGRARSGLPQRPQQGEGVGARRARLGAVDDEQLPVGVGDGELLVVQLDVADDRVAQAVHTAARMRPSVVARPESAEQVALH
jgi:hypothetical protein